LFVKNRLQAEQRDDVVLSPEACMPAAENESLGPDDIPHIGEHFVVRIQVTVTQTAGQRVRARLPIVECD
jgi:hypothetical protein